MERFQTNHPNAMDSSVWRIREISRLTYNYTAKKMTVLMLHVSFYKSRPGAKSDGKVRKSSEKIGKN